MMLLAFTSFDYAVLAGILLLMITVGVVAPTRRYSRTG